MRNNNKQDYTDKTKQHTALPVSYPANKLPDNIINRTNNAETLRPTIEAYGALETTFDFFNHHLIVRQFGIQLPHVMLTMPKNSRYQGYFQHDSWGTNRNEHISASEIALNPQFFKSQIEVCQTLVHEMVHLGQAIYQEIFGRHSPRGYHNKAFAKSMIAVGLMPSTTGKPGGKLTGVSMSDYVIEGEVFACTYERFIQSGHEIRWSSKNGGIKIKEKERDQKRRSKTKYACAVCGLNAWAKPEIKIACVECAALMQEVLS